MESERLLGIISRRETVMLRPTFVRLQRQETNPFALRIDGD